LRGRPLNRRYYDLLETRIAASTAASFDELVRQTVGAWPPDVAAVLDWLAVHGTISPATYARLRQRTPTPAPPPNISWLRPPLPQRREWRFTAATASAIVDLLHDAAGIDGEILLLGTPSLAPAVERAGRAGLHIDIYQEHTSALRSRLTDVATRQLDLLQPLAQSDLPTARFAVAIADPPWYPRELTAFIHAASRALRPGGLLVVVGPDRATRPSAADDLDQLLEAAAAAGLAPTEQSSPVARYESPPFEKAALQAAGFADLPFDWRTGTIKTLRATGEPDLPPSPPGAPPRRRWVTVRMGRSAAEIRPGAPSDDGNGMLSPIVDGAVFDSISTRHPLYDQIDIWTTGNRGYVADDRRWAHVDGMVPAPLTSVLLEEDRWLQGLGWTLPQ
jgi:hypothetical protein